MCWFIYLRVAPEGQPGPAEARVAEAAASHGLRLEGAFPAYRVTNGQCACDLVREQGRRVEVEEFVAALVRAPEVKNASVGWAWTDALPESAPTERMELAEFQRRNESAELSPDVWYRLNDPTKYARSAAGWN